MNKEQQSQAEPLPPPIPPALLSRNPLAWLLVFGPGAILASIIVSCSGLMQCLYLGASFDFRIVLCGLLIASILKWGLIFTMARHMTVSGVHPCRRIVYLPGHHGWFVLMLLFTAAIYVPFAVCSTSLFIDRLMHTVIFDDSKVLWSGACLVAVGVLTLLSGYRVLQSVQLTILGAMIICVTVAFVGAIDLGNLNDQASFLAFRYQQATQVEYPDGSLANQPSRWRFTIASFTLLAGTAFDCLAYTSWLREKAWGLAGADPATPQELERMAATPGHPIRRCIRAPLIDCLLGLAMVLAVGTVFVILGFQFSPPPSERITFKAVLYMTTVMPYRNVVWLLMLLAGLGTLYGIFEIGKAVVREIARSMVGASVEGRSRTLAVIAVSWCVIWSLGIVVLPHLSHESSEDYFLRVKDLVFGVILFAPALSLGLFCFLALWMDGTFLPKGLRMPAWLAASNFIAGMVFVTLGLLAFWFSYRVAKPPSHWTEERWFAVAGLLGTIIVSMIVAWIAERWQRKRRRLGIVVPILSLLLFAVIGVAVLSPVGETLSSLLLWIGLSGLGCWLLITIVEISANWRARSRPNWTLVTRDDGSIRVRVARRKLVSAFVLFVSVMVLFTRSIIGVSGVIVFGDSARDFVAAALSLLFIIAVAQKYLHLTRRMRTRSVWRALNGARRPILFLRPFQADGARNYRFSMGAYTVEEELVNQMQLSGPVIAVGRPEDKLPPAGSSRIYASEENWRDVVLDLIAKAQAVMIQVSPERTEGMEFELCAAADSAELDKVLLVAPMASFSPHVAELREGRYARFREWTASILPSLPDRLGNSMFIYFDELRKGHLLRSRVDCSQSEWDAQTRRLAHHRLGEPLWQLASDIRLSRITDFTVFWSPILVALVLAITLVGVLVL